MSVSVQSVVNQNGGAVLTFVDHLGDRYVEVFAVPSGWSQTQLDAYAATRASECAEMLAVNEAQRVTES